MPSVKFELRTARASDVRDLRENWRLSFGDTDDYLAFFFSRRFSPDDTLVAEVGSRVVSQLFLLPASLRAGNALMRADYLFAAATHPEYRGRGIMAALLSRARATCAERGKDAIVLLPGTTELYRYYGKHGYTSYFTRRRLRITRSVLSDYAVPVVKAEDAAAVLEQIFACRDGLCWDRAALDYALAEHRAFRGVTFSSEHAFVALSDDEATCLCKPEHFGECASLLLKNTDLSAFSLILPADVPLGTIEEGGMLCRLCERPIQLRDAFICFAME